MSSSSSTINIFMNIFQVNMGSLQKEYKTMTKNRFLFNDQAFG
ncbi:hypothetical protein LEP1GSC202_0874 [Leptospira yanagawae serovar Saopaulo str. Sao Paulo = ATCC 700523]|uniref:Uncharacterized protein n=1 Tax=Leptospira yanagawae serovar Saopaulo str. Sao Paulo = ATCC 700523 TaxID=1249483 RepID=A0A5E8HGY7_9LEPT|nr:hypothetical protein LEP1GSC202_0874 [Leptospira yanagawae serovar Saopaulo str. Sao Paulo = ATCC 700523]